MPTVTYEKIASTVLGSSNATITFSSIPQTYSDLRVVVVGTVTSDIQFGVRFNGDSSSVYSQVSLRGTGTAAASNRANNGSRVTLPPTLNFSSTTPAMVTFDVIDYRGATFKSLLGSAAQDYNGSGQVEMTVGMWRSTSAITSLELGTLANAFATGTTATLYGIL